VDAFVAERSPRAYEKVVDRLLASPRYGERMAQDWLDAARFADSNGYQVDRDREMWRGANGSSRLSIATCHSISSRRATGW